jgi:putative sterol carrier protein
VTESTEEFMNAIHGRHEPLLEQVQGTIRIELDEDGAARRWYLTIDDGEVTVSRRRAAAGCTVRTRLDTFDAIVRGETNAVAAVIRGAVTVEGDLELLVRFQRVFPGPPATASGRATGKGARR